MLPATLTFPLSAGITGQIIARTLKYRYLNIFAFMLLVGGLGAFTVLDELSPVSLQIVLLLIVGTGCGIPFISKVFMAQAAVAERGCIYGYGCRGNGNEHWGMLWDCSCKFCFSE